MTSKKRREDARATRKGRPAPPPAPEPAAEPPAPILKSPLGGKAWERVKRAAAFEAAGEDEHDFWRALKQLIAHTIVREKILADLTLRLDSLHAVGAKESHYSDQLFRRHATEKLGFMARALEGAVVHDIVAERHDAGG